MAASIRHRFSPIAGVITLGFSIAFVAAIQMFMSFFEHPVAVARTSSVDQPLVVRPGENTDTVAPLKLELSCYDPHVLPIWHELKKDEIFKDRLEYSSGPLNCSEMIEVRRVDLNRDGLVEMIARGKGPELCGATGNCGFWVFELKKSRARNLLAAHDFDFGLYNKFGQQVQRSKTRGYSDILLAGHSTAAQTSYRTFKYDGRRYIESRCVYEIPKTGRVGEGSMQLVLCRELDRGK